MSLPKEKAWFPAKRYGYGWGLPTRWQGWVVMLLFIAGMAASGPLLPAHPAWFAISTVALTAALIAVCLWKGEAPRWRWGERDSAADLEKK